MAAVLRDVIADETALGTPLLCEEGHHDPTPALLGLVRSNGTGAAGVCSDLTSDPRHQLLAVSRVTGFPAYRVFWSEVKQQGAEEYGVRAGFGCGPTCGKEYQYRVGRREGAWRVLGKSIVLMF